MCSYDEAVTVCCIVQGTVIMWQKRSVVYWKVQLYCGSNGLLYSARNSYNVAKTFCCILEGAVILW